MERADTVTAPEFSQALTNHLNDCHINWKKYKKLNKILSSIRQDAGTSEDLLEKFTLKCYASQPDRELAHKQAKAFLEALFGSCSTLYTDGPNKALEKKVREIQRSLKPDVSDSKIIDMELLPGAGPSSSLDWDGKSSTSETAKLWRRRIGQYLVGPVLGNGGTAKVRLGLNYTTKEEVAIKILKPRFKDDAIKEIETLQDMSHENIIQVKDSFLNVRIHGSYNKPTSVFVLEYADKGELIEYLMYTERFKPDLARWFFKALVNAVEHCHKKGYCHRDLKHDNCLLGNNFVVKVTDFGFTKKWNEKGMMNTAIGTEQYAAPEILAHKPYSKAVDIFAMGVMLFIALAGCQPFKRADHKDRWYSMIVKGDWKGFWKYHQRAHKFESSARKLLEKMLVEHPEKRITIEEIKACRWWNGKTLDQDQAAKQLAKRKAQVDKEKYSLNEGDRGREHRSFPNQPCPIMYWTKEGPQSSFWFYTSFDGPDIQKHLVNTIRDNKGEVILPSTAQEKEPTFDLGEILDGNDDDMFDNEESDEEENEDYIADGRRNPYTGKFSVVAEKKLVKGVWNVYTEMLSEEEFAQLARKKDKIRRVEEEMKKFAQDEREKLMNEAESQLKESGMGGKVGVDVEREVGVDLENIEVEVARRLERRSPEILNACGLKNVQPFYTEIERREIFKKRNIVVFRQDHSTSRKRVIKNTNVLKKDYNRSLYADVYKKFLADFAFLMEVPYVDEDSEDENSE